MKLNLNIKKKTDPERFEDVRNFSFVHCFIIPLGAVKNSLSFANKYHIRTRNQRKHSDKFRKYTNGITKETHIRKDRARLIR